ncbi:ABC transporter substrate-binding protein [Rugosimonospora africana]|uniref:Myristoyl transferase n=1 Tax=Rugosimonospora africana TaxID=556532 RepID=A0A8J3QP23_9ACTN|nr:ABC transporter substrate-binding protein [Rugosimonospora africana]GIH12576.1 myristoyl transferase [Rugosimonospora africana]
MASRRQVLATIAATATAPVTAAIAAPTLVACGRSEKPTGRKAIDKVSVLTGFGTTPRESYSWVADGMGFFREAGIQVSIQPGAPSDANLKILASGKAQFAIVDFVSAVRGASSEWPNFRVIAAIQHSTLLSMVSLPDRRIALPIDLSGKTLGTASAAATQTLFPTYARLAGIDPARVKIVNLLPDQLPAALASGRIDAEGAYLVDTPIIRKAAGGREPVVLPYAKYLTDLYGSVLITTTSLIRTRPDLARRFGTAMLRGIRYAVEAPEDAARVAHAALAVLDPDMVAQTMRQMRPYVDSGVLDETRVMRGISLLEAAGLIGPGLTPDRVVDFSLAPKGA